MSVLIKGMAMPKDEEMLCINIYPDGKVCINLDLECTQIATAVSVPPHGDLIDLSAKVNAQYYDDADEEWSIKTVTVEDILYSICDEMPPTIIHAEEGE